MFVSALTATDVYVRVSTGTPWATLILAALGVLLSLAALGWQLYTVLFITGSRVRVTISRGLAGAGAVITWKEGTADSWIATYRSQGYTQPVIAVTVNNRGRGETSVTDIGIELKPSGIVVKEPTVSPPLPHPIKGEHAQTWHLDATAVDAAVQTSEQMWPEQKGKIELEATVELGSGKEVSSRNRLRG